MVGAENARYIYAGGKGSPSVYCFLLVPNLQGYTV